MRKTIASRWLYLKSVYVIWRRHKVTFVLSLAYGVLGAASLFIPAVANFLQKAGSWWSWHWWVIGLLVIACVALFEGGYRHSAELGGHGDPLTQSAGLGKLTTYPQDVELEVRKACFQIGDDTLFVYARMVSKSSVGIKDVSVEVDTESGKIKLAQVEDLSKWTWVKDIVDEQGANTQDVALDTVSLWKSVQAGGLQAGVYKDGWMAFGYDRQLGQQYLTLDKVISFRFVVEDGQQRVYRQSVRRLLRCEWGNWEIQTRDKVIPKWYRSGVPT